MYDAFGNLAAEMGGCRWHFGTQSGYQLDAADRVQTVQNVNAATNYASLNYTTVPGNTLTMIMGNGVTEQPSYNDRLQPIGLQVSSSAGSLLGLGLFPCIGGATALRLTT